MQINNVIDLDAAIAEMEKKRVIQETILKNQYRETIDHYRPKNLIKSAFKGALEPGETGNTILKTVGGIGAGLLAKNLVFGAGATSLLGKFASNALTDRHSPAAVVLERDAHARPLAARDRGRHIPRGARLRCKTRERGVEHEKRACARACDRPRLAQTRLE